MQILSYGFKNPENGDKGSVWFPALNFNILQLNSHNHDGITSALIPASAVQPGSVSLPAASWTGGSGLYQQDGTVPVGYSFDSANIQFRITSTGSYVYPTVDKLTTTTFRVYTNDNTLSYTAVFR